MKRFFKSLFVTLAFALVGCVVCFPLVAFGATGGALPAGLSFDPTLIVTTVLVYALTTAAKALGLPDATAPVRAFAALVALLIPIALAWHGGTLAAYDWNTALPSLWTVGQALVNALVVYLAAGGLNAHVKDALKQ